MWVWIVLLQSLTRSFTHSVTQIDNRDDITHYGLARKHKNRTDKRRYLKSEQWFEPGFELESEPGFQSGFEPQ